MEYFENSSVIVPFDFSEQSISAVEFTLNLIDETSQVHVIHVVESSLLASMDMASPLPPILDQDQQKTMLEKLQAFFQDARFQQVKQHCVIGDPGYEIAHLAEREQADLIVMPSHGRSGLDRLLLGSVTERVLRLSHCPTLVLKGDSANYESDIFPD